MLSVQFSSKNSFLSIFDILNVTKCQKSPIQVMHRLIDKIFLNSVNSSLGIYYILWHAICSIFIEKFISFNFGHFGRHWMQKSPIQVMHRLIDRIYLKSVISSLGILKLTLTCYLYNLMEKYISFNLWPFHVTEVRNHQYRWCTDWLTGVFEFGHFESRQLKIYFYMLSFQLWKKNSFLSIFHLFDFSEGQKTSILWMHRWI